MIEITFNGKIFKIEEGRTLKEFLEENLTITKFAIEINMEVVPKSNYGGIVLQNEMKIEAITFVGGG
jgi:thiamine biosynthesis protein ThiS